MASTKPASTGSQGATERTSPAEPAAASEPTPTDLPITERGRGPSISLPSHWWSGYVGAMFIMAPLMPGLVAIVTVAWYLLLTPLPWSATSAPANPGGAIVAGLVVTALVWFGGGVLARRMVTARHAQHRLYADLLERSRSLMERAHGIGMPPETEEALSEANAHLSYVHDELESDGSRASIRWALATGYLSVLSSLHRAEEALIVVEPPDAVVGDALHDALSLEDSTIDNNDRLLRILRPALDAVCADTSVFLIAGTPVISNPAHPMDEKVARQTLREIRFAINQYVEDKLGSLVRARNRLVWTMLAVGFATYLLLGLALAAAVPVPQILAVTAFYLVGAIVGLFNRLRLEVGRSGAVEDFGLSMARLVVTPLLSGLAAVAGVYLIAVAPSLFPTGQTAAPLPPTLTHVFDLGTNAVGLVYAAIFGLAPNTLTNQLAAASGRIEREIASTGPSTGTATKEGD
jgi:hypothetical protein